MRRLDIHLSCHEIIQASRGRHLHGLASHYGRLDRGIPVPLLSHFFPGPPHILHSNPNFRYVDSNPSEERPQEPQHIYFGEGLDENSRVLEIESLHCLKDHKLTLVELTEEIKMGIEEEPRTLKIGTGLNPAQRARMIDFFKEYQEEEVVKQINVGFLKICNYSEWVANIVPLEKKDGRVRVCVDYRNLNKASPKDDFPLPHIDV
ncbi:hypothetical protein CRG98_010165 [Punica granatum]|uniref:Reverse transcriptase domain-containing protein n=1 Tax=Punica granatum TaxID=22663 RepID=A0A2I0KLT2_PUNGR|nr:hypothetical protein CRG98_010165 [Punica granatum]